MAIAWNFPGNNNTTINGISDAGIEDFKGNLYGSLAREICQNSIDACKDKNKPVKVEFNEFLMDVKNIPDEKNLYNALSGCMNYWTEYDNVKGQEFFENAINLINNEQVEVLRVSDYNTTGLNGADKEINSNWSNLIKGNGVSNKGGDAGGSFGIGKSAPFACSDLRTVFYSTLDTEGKMASQGVSRLTSFKYKDYTTMGIGYYGDIEKNTPIMKMIRLDENFNRNETGTDIYILAFCKEDNWDIEILCAILNDFLVAIRKGLLEVKVNNILLSKETLNDIFQKYNDFIDENTKNYYEVLTNPNRSKIEWNFNGCGNVILYLLQKDGFCRKVYMSRKTGMKIFEQNRLSTFIQFAGILILEDEKVNSFFKKMETPQHNKWEPDRVTTNKQLARKYKSDLYRQIKDKVNELQKIDKSKALDIEGLGEYLADEETASDGESSKKESIENKINEIIVNKVPEEKIKGGFSDNSNNEENDDIADMRGTQDDEAEGYGIVNQGGQKNNTTGGGKLEKVRQDADGKDNYKKEIKVNPIMTRIFCTNKDSNEYCLVFELNRSIKEGYIKFNILGEQGEVEAEINKAAIYNSREKLRFRVNKVFVYNISKGIKNRITFSIKYEDYCTLGVGIYEIEA